MPMLKNLNGKVTPMTPEEEAEHARLMPTDEQRAAATRDSLLGTLRYRTERRLIATLIDADPDYQAAAAAIQKAGTEDEIRAAFTAATKQETSR